MSKKPITTLHNECLAQAMRLLIFPAIKKNAIPDYCDWLEGKCRNKEEAKALIDAALYLERPPSLADLGRIWGEQHPPRTAPELTGEEREQSKQFMRDWKAEELAGVEERRAKFLEWLEAQKPVWDRQREKARKPAQKTEPPKPVTQEDLDRAHEVLRQVRERDEARKAAASAAPPQAESGSKSA